LSVFRGGVTLDPIVDELLKQVRQELGYKEQSGQLTKFGQWYAVRAQDTQYRHAPWCDMFISWAADKAGISQYVGQFAWTPSHAAWFIKQGAWTQRPEPGALVFFDWSGGKNYKGIDHVGIVERVEGKKIHTIEANVEHVWLKRKTRDTDKVVGYGLPRLVKAGTDKVAEIRSTEQPFVPAPRADVRQHSPMDVLGTPPALLAAMVLMTVVLSLRVSGRRRGIHRRFTWPWNAPTGSRGDKASPGETWAPRVTVPAARKAGQDGATPREGKTSVSASASRSGKASEGAKTASGAKAPARERVTAGTGRSAAGRATSTRRKPYEPKG
jgi:hypothetical protein